MAKTSGVIVLATPRSQGLVGSMMSGLDDDGVAWVQLSFFALDGSLRLEERGDQSCLLIDRDLVDSMVGSLVVLLAAIPWMGRDTMPRHAFDGIAVEVLIARRGQPGLVQCCWPTQTDGIQRERVGDQWNLRFREEVISQLVEMLIRELGRVVAGSP